MIDIIWMWAVQRERVDKLLNHLSGIVFNILFSPPNRD